MAKIFITGSSDGLGQLVANLLIQQGHRVVLHARNTERAKQTATNVLGAEKVLVADLSSINETKKLSTDVNSLGNFDTIIHNAGLYHVTQYDRSLDGLPLIFAVNSLAPYILTCLIQKPKRLIYLSSDMHLQADPLLNNLSIDSLRKGISPNYSDSKLHNLILSMAVARKWPMVFSNAVHPGWVPTKMGGNGAPDNLLEGAETQVWLATSNDEKAKVSGRYFYHQKEKHFLDEAADVKVQEKFLSLCEDISGIRFPY